MKFLINPPARAAALGTLVILLSVVSLCCLAQSPPNKTDPTSEPPNANAVSGATQPSGAQAPSPAKEESGQSDLSGAKSLGGWVSPARAASVRDQYISIDGAKIHYVEAGAGQAVVLLHGNDGTLRDFTMSLFDKVAAKYRTITFDRPGHGESETPKHEETTPATQARVLHELLNKIGVSNPLLVAHSWSGSLALSYALQFPDDLRGIVMLSGMAYDTKEGAAKPSYYAVKVPLVGNSVAVVYKLAGRRLVEKQLRQAFAPDPAPQPYVDQFLSSMFRVSQLKAAARDEITLNPALKTMSPDYGKIAVPVVIVCGEQDKTVAPSQHGYRLHKEIPQSHLIVVKNGGHELQFTHPQEVIKAIDLALETARTWQQAKSLHQPAKSSLAN